MLCLALLATEHDNTLILDEPTNHLDIDSKEVLEDALIAFDGTLLFVSHDRYFINRLATQVVEITPQGVKTYLGDYDYYQEKKAKEALIAQSQASEVGTEPSSANTVTFSCVMALSFPEFHFISIKLTGTARANKFY